MSDAQPTTLVAPDGQRFDVPAAGVAKLKAKGFRELNDAERKDVELQQKFGEGILPPIGAALSGAASTATFGGSDLALAQTPLAEANRELAERNPTAHTVGQVAGIALPIAGQLAGATAAGKAATVAGSAISGASKVAQGVGSAVAKGAEAVGLKGAAPVLGAAAQAATEGAAFQVGSNIGAAARRDVPLDAETLLAHTGEAAILGAGIGAAIPVAGKVARWTAEKAIAGLEQGAQAVRALTAGAARAGVDVAESAAGKVAQHADDIGAAVEGAGQRIAQTSDDVLLPRIREGLTKQTGRADVVDDVFAATPEARALREKLGSETLTGTRAVESERLGKALNEVWDQTLGNKPMFDDLALAVKKDLQRAELEAAPLTKQQQRAIVKAITTEAQQTLEQLGKFNGTAQTFFAEALDDFAKRATKAPTAESLYMGLDGLKTATDKIAKFAKGAELGDTGAAFAAEEARRFRTVAKQMLEDEQAWGTAGALQHEVNAAYSKYRRAFDLFEKQFATPKAKGQAARVLDGGKITKWSRDITKQAGDVRNAVVDDLVEAQTELIALTDRLSKRAQQQARELLAGGGGSPAAQARAATIEASPDAISGVLAEGARAAQGVAAAKTAATKAIDRAEVLQETQSAILSRQGAGVNPLPVELAQKIGAGALVGGAIGGMPGAIVGGGITSVLQKYGAITSNPKSAIEFLNAIDRMRSIDKERVASWLKTTMGGAKEFAPKARATIDRASEVAASKILRAREAAETGVGKLAARAEAATPNVMRRLLPAVSYADVQNSTPEEWWRRTQRALVRAQVSPDKLLDEIKKDVEGIASDLPGVADAIARQKLAVLGYLAEHMPRNPRPYALDGREWTPDPGAAKAFRGLVLVATNPDALLPLITMGTASREQVDAVRTLWPRKFEQTKAQITEAVREAAEEGRPLPYQARIQLGQLLGVPLDPSQEPGFLSWLNQAPASQPAAQQDGAQTIRAPLKIDTKIGLPTSARAAERF